MTTLDLSDIQGIVVRGYRFPVAAYLFLRIGDAAQAREFLKAIRARITSAQPWVDGKPRSTLNIAFTFKALQTLGLPADSLAGFPVEFQQGMSARSDILNDTGINDPQNWEALWQPRETGEVHIWLGLYAQSPEILEAEYARLKAEFTAAKGLTELAREDAAALVVDGQPTAKEHFGFTDGIGNPDFDGSGRGAPPGQGKLRMDRSWAPLATGEFLLGYPDEADEVPPAPLPHLLSVNGTFMVYRKLHQNVASFRKYLDQKSEHYAGGREKLAAKFAGRWRDGTPIERSPDRPDPSLAADPLRNNDFTYADDASGARCPLSSHIRRVNPRDAFGFNGALANRRRVLRRGLPYGAYTPDDQPASDSAPHGVHFMILNASIFRQFEFVQQQWIEYGNDAAQGNDKDSLVGNHGGSGKVVVQGTTDPLNPPFICARLPNFVELKGGDYFFMPSLTALGMIADGSVDPR